MNVVGIRATTLLSCIINQCWGTLPSLIRVKTLLRCLRKCWRAARKNSSCLGNLCGRQFLNLTPAATLLKGLRVEQGLLFGVEVLVGGLDRAVTHASHRGDVLG